MAKYSIHYYALLAEQSQVSQEMIESEAQTCIELYEFLRAKYNFSLESKYLQVAINDEFKPLDHKLEDGDKVVFIPPVAGG